MAPPITAPRTSPPTVFDAATESRPTLPLFSAAHPPSVSDAGATTPAAPGIPPARTTKIALAWGTIPSVAKRQSAMDAGQHAANLSAAPTAPTSTTARTGDAAPPDAWRGAWRTAGGDTSPNGPQAALPLEIAATSMTPPAHGATPRGTSAHPARRDTTLPFDSINRSTASPAMARTVADVIASPVGNGDGAAPRPHTLSAAVGPQLPLLPVAASPTRRASAIHRAEQTKATRGVGRLILIFMIAAFLGATQSLLARRDAGRAALEDLRTLDLARRRLDANSTRLQQQWHMATSRPMLRLAAEQLGLRIPADTQIVLWPVVSTQPNATPRATPPPP